MTRRQRRRNQRLRKQPKMRRIQSAHVAPLPRATVPRTAKKRRRRNQRRVRFPTEAIKGVIFSPRWVSMGLLALVVYALVLTGLEEDFYLTVLPVEGTASIPPAEIVAASGLAGAHIFAADPVTAAGQIAEVPGVVTAAVTLSWPNQALIEVVEDSPVAVWQEGERQYWITEDGRLLPARTTTPGLLVIESGLAVETVTEAADTEAETAVADEEADEAVTTDTEPALAFMPPEVLVGALQLRTLRPNIEKLYYRPATGLYYEDGRGWQAYFGTGADMEQKLVVYEAIVEDLLARGLTPLYVSVSNQEKPYYRTQ